MILRRKEKPAGLKAKAVRWSTMHNFPSLTRLLSKPKKK